jgi:hypothetical protein
MSQHRILGNEADQEKPLAYVRMFRTSRRRHRGYVLAAAAGVVLAAIAGTAWVLIQGGLAGPIR